MPIRNKVEKDFIFSILAGMVSGIFFTPVIFSFFPEANLFGNLEAGMFLGFLGAVFMFFVFGFVRFLNHWWNFMEQIGKFGIVGVLNTAVDLFVLGILISLSGEITGGIFSLFKAISFTAGAVNSYLWNKWWTFESSKKISSNEFIRFFIPTVIGGIINVLVATLVVALISQNGEITGTIANVAAIIATVVALIWNFVCYKYFVFSTKKTQRI